MPQVKHRLNVGKNLHGGRAFQSVEDKDAAGVPLPVGSPVGVLLPTITGQFFFSTALNTVFVSTGLTAADWAPLSSGGAAGNRAQLNGGRLSLLTGEPVPTADVLAATSVFFNPYAHDNIAIFTGTVWNTLLIPSAGISLSLAALAANTNFDVFGFDSGASTLALELSAAWASDIARTDAIGRQNGVFVKTADDTRRYLGTFRTTAVVGQSEDGAIRRFIWNADNRVERHTHTKGNAGWNVTSASFVNMANALMTHFLVVGLAEDVIEAGVNTSGQPVASNPPTVDYTYEASLVVSPDAGPAPSSEAAGGRTYFSNAHINLQSGVSAHFRRNTISIGLITIQGVDRNGVGTENTLVDGTGSATGLYTKTLR